MILLDTETTDLTQISAKPLDSQGRIIELAAMKLDPGLNPINTISFFVDPGIPIPEKVTKITGITDEMVRGKGSFARHLPVLSDFFVGETVLVAHNLPFDKRMLMLELLRLDRLTFFPWPPEQLCTVELTQDITGKYLSLTDLYRHYYGTDPEQKHRAMGDVEILRDIIVRMHEEGRI